MQEAKGSWNGYYKSAAGNKEQFTLRQEDGQSDADFILRVKSFDKALSGNGYKPLASAQDNGSTNTAKPQGATAPPATGDKFIEVESINLAAGGDHPRWVVKGGKFKKFGITCWPETLEAAGVAEKLDPLKDNKPKGNWIAYYTERQDDEGKWAPDKVTRLEKKA